MALDAVMRLIEHSGQHHAGIGKLEPFAMAKLRIGQRHARDAVDLYRLHRDQVVHVELMRNPKQNSVMMFGLSGGRKRRPRRVLLGDREVCGMFGFGLEPGRDVIDETLLS